MKIYILSILLFSFLSSESVIKSISGKNNKNLFITDYEYGQVLYENPRGIGCIKCHGVDGKGKFIARYTHKKKEYEIVTPAINKVDLKRFKQVLKTPNKKSIMPTYFLTNDEMKQIHFYITNREE